MSIKCWTLTNQKKFSCMVGFSGKIIDKDDLERRKKNGPETFYPW